MAQEEINYEAKYNEIRCRIKCQQVYMEFTQQVLQVLRGIPRYRFKAGPKLMETLQNPKISKDLETLQNEALLLKKMIANAKTKERKQEQRNSALLMEQCKAISRKRKPEPEEMIAIARSSSNRKRWSGNGGIDKLSDDALINILSHMSIKEAARTSVLAHRWRYLWRSFHGTLRFDQRDTSTGNLMERETVKSWVNAVRELHQGPYIEGIVVSFDDELYRYEIQSLVCFANQKEIEKFELNVASRNFSNYPFGIISPSRRLRSLRLVHVGVKAYVVEEFLASCPNLEELCIQFSYMLFADILRVVDKPSLRVLEISRCPFVQGLEVSAVNLVSLTYGGERKRLVLKEVPNLRKLTIRDGLCLSFLSEPTRYYSVQLEKLVLDFQTMDYYGITRVPEFPQFCSLKRLDVQVYHTASGSLFLFTSLIKASPNLCEFRIQLRYSINCTINSKPAHLKPTFPCIMTKNGKLSFHKNLKAVEMAGYIGSLNEDFLLLELIHRCPSIEKVVIDTKRDYSDDCQLKYYSLLSEIRQLFRPPIVRVTTTRNEAKRRAKRLASDTPTPIKFIVT